MEAGYDEIEVGWVVYTSDYRRLGTVHAVNLPESYVVLQKGRIFGQDMYVPLEGIARAGGGVVHLIYDQAQIDARDWSSVPTGRLGVTEAGGRDEPTLVMPTGDETTIVTSSSAPSGDGQDAGPGPDRRQDAVPPAASGVPGVQTGVEVEPEAGRAQSHHDTIRVERVPMDADYEGDDAFQETVIEIPLMSQRLIVGKRARVVEEIRVYKRTAIEEVPVSESVRKERVQVEEVRAEEP